jgi:hypothetical protein
VCPETSCDSCDSDQTCFEFAFTPRGCDAKCSTASCKDPFSITLPQTGITLPQIGITLPAACCDGEQLECVACSAGYPDREAFCADHADAKGCTDATDIIEAQWNRGCKELCVEGNEATSCGSCEFAIKFEVPMPTVRDADDEMMLTRQKRCEATCARQETLSEAADVARNGKFKLQVVNTNAQGLAKLLQGADVIDAVSKALGIDVTVGLRAAAAAVSAEFDLQIKTNKEKAEAIREMIADCKAVSSDATAVEKCTADELSELADSLLENEALSDEAQAFVDEFAPLASKSLGDESDAASQLSAATTAVCLAVAAAAVIV